MVFRATAENGGVVDPAINKLGRIRGVKEKSRRELKSIEMLSLVRKIKPHLSDSIMTAASIMRNKEAGPGNQLKAAVILLNAYKELIGDLYDGDDEEEGQEIQPNTPSFSLHVLPPKVIEE